MPTVSSDTDLALPPIPGSSSGVREKPQRSAPPRSSLPPKGTGPRPLPRATLPPTGKKSSWDDADDAATVKEAPKGRAKPSAPPPPRLPVGSLPPTKAVAKVDLVKKRAPSRPPIAPSPTQRRLPPKPAPANDTMELDIPALSPAPRRSAPPPTPPSARKRGASMPPPPPPRSSLPPAPPAAAMPSPQPAPAPRGVKKISSDVQTLLGVVAPKAGERALGPNPFGPETMEFDIAPYLMKVPVEISPRALAVAVVLVCFVLGSALAVAATGGEEPEPPATRIEEPAPIEAPAAEHEPAPQPRLVDLMPEPESAQDHDDVRSARAVIDPDPQPAVDDRQSRLEAIRARRQARRRARIRARWLRNHGRR